MNPLYDEFDRVGCFPCLASGDKWKDKAFTYDDFGRAQYAKVIRIGAQIGKTVWTSKAGKAAHCETDGSGCALCAT